MVKLIVFDLDGTLIDSRHDLAGAVNHMRGSMGLEPLATERIVRFVGNGVANLVRRAIADSDVDFEEALRRMKRYYAGHLVETTALYPGVSRGLAELREAGIQLAVLSNKPTDASRRILDCLGVGGCFADIIGGVLSSLLGKIPVLGSVLSALISLLLLAYTLFGIITAGSGKAKELPFIGGLMHVFDK